MRTHRLVLVSAALVSVLVTTTAEARPHFPFGAVFGMVGGLLGMRYYHHYHHRWAARERENAARERENHVAVANPEQPGANRSPSAGSAASTEPPASPTNPAAAGQIALPAQLFWPRLPDELADYVFWPSGTDDAFWSHGYRDVVDDALRPAGHRLERAAAEPPATGSSSTVASAGEAAAGACPGEPGAELADGVVGRIEQLIQPSDAQQAALGELRAAARHGFEYFDSACASERGPSPTSRLDAMEDRIWAARQALLIIRAPLDALYASLTDEQKARLNGPTVPPDQRESTCAQTLPGLPLGQLERGSRPRPDQRAGLEALKSTSLGLAKMLASSCPSGMPATPVGRLDAADKRLNSLLYAVVTLRAPLDAVSASLDEAEKARANARR